MGLLVLVLVWAKEFGSFKWVYGEVKGLTG